MSCLISHFSFRYDQLGSLGNDFYSCVVIVVFVTCLCWWVEWDKSKDTCHAVSIYWELSLDPIEYA